MPPVQLSLCLIFRDEEAMLPDFLASVHGLWDELIAVDTGSVDDSARLLADAGAQISHFTWIDDFAAARNASLEAATGEWILFLDADERVDDELKRAIRDLVNDQTAGAATVTMRNELPGGHRRDSRLLRLFRNDPGIRFRYRIHEDVSTDVDAFLRRNGLKLVHLPGVVNHLGYVREVAADRDKKERDLKILELALEQDPDDFYCRFKILEIARFWADQELWQDQSRTCQALLDQLSASQAATLKKRQWSGELAALVAGGLLLNPGQTAADVLTWLENTHNWSQPSVPWLLRRAILLEECGSLDDAVRSYQKCLTAQNEASLQMITTRPLLGLCRIALAQDKTGNAIDFALQAAETAPLDEEALLALATCGGLEAESSGSRSSSLPQVVADFVTDHPDACAALARQYLTLKRINEAAIVLRAGLENIKGPEAADLALGLLVCTLVQGEDFDHEIATDQETADSLMRQWTLLLWQSRHTEAMASFAENCQAVTGVFPWLPEFLAAETARLQG